MPELPEVETIRRQLGPEIEGSRIVTVEVLDPRWTMPSDPAEVEAACAGRLIERVRRRGKYLVVDLDRDLHLVMHLRMTGSLELAEAGAQRPYLRARIALGDGRDLLFCDQRRFGQGIVLDGDALEPYFRARLGVEPLSAEFTAERIGRLAAGRVVPLKSFLLVQAGIAGVGNIYADEALFRARLHPLSPAGSMRPEHWARLRDGVVAALEAGLDNGGATIDDYRDARGAAGSMQDEFLVHRREGLPCRACGEAIRRVVVGGRSTYYCGRCQVRLRRRRRRAAAARRRQPVPRAER
jgi:formamidopyrimidine-DNA glycosylase